MLELIFPTKQDLKAIGIEKRGHRKRLLIEIEKLPQVEIPQEVPVSHCRRLLTINHFVLVRGTVAVFPPKKG